MDADIETCYDEGPSNQSEEINFESITRYYRILSSQVENSAGKINFKLIVKL